MYVRMYVCMYVCMYVTKGGCVSRPTSLWRVIGLSISGVDVRAIGYGALLILMHSDIWLRKSLVLLSLSLSLFDVC